MACSNRQVLCKTIAAEELVKNHKGCLKVVKLPCPAWILKSSFAFLVSGCQNGTCISLNLTTNTTSETRAGRARELMPWPHSRNETQQVISKKQTDITARRGPTTRDLMTPWLILFCLATLINYQRQIINEKMCIFWLFLIEWTSRGHVLRWGVKDVESEPVKTLNH